MARHHVYSGFYDRNAHTSFPNSKDFRWLFNVTLRYFWMLYSVMCDNYLAVATIIAVVMLSFIIPDISKKIHATNELGDMKKVVDLMSEEVRLAEAACLTDVNEICQLHCSMQDDATETSKIQRDVSLYTSNNMRSTQSVPIQIENKNPFLRRTFPAKNTSHKEIAIMSYVYTDSFDDNHKINKNDSEVSER